MAKTDGGRESLDRQYRGHTPEELEADHMPNWTHSAQSGARIPDDPANLNNTPARLLALQLNAAGYRCTVTEDKVSKQLVVRFPDGAVVQGSGDFLRRQLCDTTPESAQWRRDHAVRFSKPDLQIRGADPRPDSNYDAEALAAGIRVEKEHTNDVEVAKVIAKDHLDERKDYYKVVAKVGL